MKKILLLITILCLLLGCSLINGPSKKNPTKYQFYKYPLQVGNSWTYEQTRTINNLRPEGFVPPAPLLSKSSATIEVTHVDSVSDSLELFELTAIGASTLEFISNDTAIFHFANNTEGMFEYGNSGGNLAIPISPPPIIDSLFIQNPKNIKKQKLSSLSTLAEAKLSLQYPIILQNEWVFLNKIGNLFGIVKKVIDYQVVETKVGTFNCFVVEWIYDFETDVQILDYYSEIGLIKRVITSKNVQLYDYADPNYGLGDITDEYLLVEFTQAE